MRLFILLCLGGMLACAAPAADDDIDVFLNYDPEPALKDETKWKVIFECLMDRGPCGDYQPVRDALLRLYANKCEKCPPEKKEKFEDILKRAVEKYPKDYGEVISKYSPKPE